MPKNIEKRIDKIERQFGLGVKKPQVIPMRVILSGRHLNEDAIKSLGPVEQWASYKQVVAQTPDDLMIIFQPDPQLELTARQRPLTKDELASLLVQPDVA